MMSLPEDPRWMEEDADSDGIFSQKIAMVYAETRMDIELVLMKIQGSLDKVPQKQSYNHTTRKQWERLLFTVKQDQIELQLMKAETYNRFDQTIGKALQHHPRACDYDGRRTAEETAWKEMSLQINTQCKPRAGAILQPPWTACETEIQAMEAAIPSKQKALPHKPSKGLRIPTVVVDLLDDSKSSCLETNPGHRLEKKTSFVKRVWRSISPHREAPNVLGKSAQKNSAVSATVTPFIVTPKKAQRVGFDIPEDQDRDITTKEIEDLCATISTAESDTVWYGVLTSGEDKWQGIRRATKPCYTSATARMVSLSELLSSRPWARKSKSLIGLKLASTVLQLYQTPWLRDDWGKEDIFFIQEDDGTVLSDKPFLRPRLSSSDTAATSAEPKTTSINMNVPCLLALGVVLIELHFQKPIDELIDELQKENNGKKENGWVIYEGEPLEVSNIKRTLLMLRLIEKMDAGANLENALRRCIKGPDGALTDMNKEELRDIVEENIIVPLENEVLWLHGCKKIEECI
ncbi:hypothetical protein EG329_003694 [Mollisiaceae sp. DMI_Dod_QoI]|nr:hypothetical protein EG329_003694 [Helotiales sp. DMI_Dod_QoI]